RCALTAKSGSVMKIHDRYCQGLSASSGSHRPTVGAEIDSQIPLATAWPASFGHDQRESGTPASAGGIHAAALICATRTAVNTGGRPHRFASPSEATPGAANHRRRHLPTVSSHTRSDTAIISSGVLSAAARTVLARRDQALLGASGPHQAAQLAALRPGQRDPVGGRHGR
ncbi:hypothetical protein ACT16_23915, partial [Mycobacterium heckeshornense]